MVGSHSHTAPHDAVTPVVTNGSRRILIADDNEDLLATLAEALELSGHVVRTARDGPTALEAALAFEPHLAFVAIGLPRMDGYEVASCLRQTPAAATTRLIALTGHALESDRRRALAAGFDLHVVKPIDLDALDDLIVGS